MSHRSAVAARDLVDVAPLDLAVPIAGRDVTVRFAGSVSDTIYRNIYLPDSSQFLYVLDDVAELNATDVPEWVTLLYLRYHNATNQDAGGGKLMQLDTSGGSFDARWHVLSNAGAKRWIISRQQIVTPGMFGAPPSGNSLTAIDAMQAFVTTFIGTGLLDPTRHTTGGAWRRLSRIAIAEPNTGLPRTGGVTVDNLTHLIEAIQHAQPFFTINVAPGEYVMDAGAGALLVANRSRMIIQAAAENTVHMNLRFDCWNVGMLRMRNIEFKRAAATGPQGRVFSLMATNLECLNCTAELAGTGEFANGNGHSVKLRTQGTRQNVYDLSATVADNILDLERSQYLEIVGMRRTGEGDLRDQVILRGSPVMKKLIHLKNGTAYLRTFRLEGTGENSTTGLMVTRAQSVYIYTDPVLDGECGMFNLRRGIVGRGAEVVLNGTDTEADDADDIADEADLAQPFIFRDMLEECFRASGGSIYVNAASVFMEGTTTSWVRGPNPSVRFINLGGRDSLVGHLNVSDDADATLTFGQHESHIRHTATLTAERTITLAPAFRGAYFVITRTGGGAFDLVVENINEVTLATLAAGEWARFDNDGVAAGWYRSASGTV